MTEDDKNLLAALNNAASIKEARALFFELAKRHFVVCPVCDRKGKIRPLKVTAGTAVQLWKLVTKFPGQFVYLVDVAKAAPDTGDSSANQLNELEKFGLIEKGKTKARKRGYKATPLAHAFVNGTARVPEELTVYDNKVILRSGQEVTFKQALGTKFDWEYLVKFEALKSPLDAEADDKDELF